MRSESNDRSRQFSAVTRRDREVKREPPFCTAADSFGAGQRMRTDQDDLRAVRMRRQCNVQVSPGHVVARRRPGYGPGMSRARGVHPIRNHEAMRLMQNLDHSY
jgi:hypothetical protein